MQTMGATLTRAGTRRLVLGVTVALVVGACSSGTTASTAPIASFGAVLASHTTVLDTPTWVKWDAASCSFKPATAPYSGPYKAVLKDAHGDGIRVVWTPEETYADNVILATNSYILAADNAGSGLNVISNNY